MTKRFTETGKWDDLWFRKLDPYSKLVFIYVCERCDCAGFWEIDIEDAGYHIGISGDAVDSALNIIGDKLVRNGKYLWIKNFLYHQGNLPLIPGHRVHDAIIRRLTQFASLSEEIQLILKGDYTLWIGEGKSASNSHGNSQRQGHGKRLLTDEMRKEFDAWWDGTDGEPPYPRKIAKSVAAEKYSRVRDSASKEELAVGKRNFVKMCEIEGREQQYIPYASTWLNQERWKEHQQAPTKALAKRLANQQTGREDGYYDGVVEK
ncbi:MAG: hypothetical protein WC763_07025 [Candidatus Paceibacterota bacterium]